MPEDDKETRERFGYLLSIPTRWMDNDIYGHVNNVVYYSYFDTVINHYLVSEGELDIHEGPVIGICAESLCRFRRALSFPQIVEAGLRVEHLGNSSVRYEIGLFSAEHAQPAAVGYFVHVFVDRRTHAPVEIPASIRQALARLRLER